MNKKQKLLFCAEAFLLAIFFMAICFWFFPRYLYQAVYWEDSSEITGESRTDLPAGVVLREMFIPQKEYLENINIHVEETAEGNLLIGSLSDHKGRVLEEHTMEARSGYVSFPVQRHVKTDEIYTFTIMGHRYNEGVVPVTFGVAVEGPAEHVESWEKGSVSDGVLWTQYVYNACSKKLLAVWFIAFLALASWILETIWKSCRNLK